jgi:hypothetical protein
MLEPHTHMSHGFYRITDAEAGKLARGVSRPLPRHGYELRVVLSGGQLAWLSRTPLSSAGARAYGHRAAAPKRGWVWAVSGMEERGRARQTSEGVERAGRSPEKVSADLEFEIRRGLLNMYQVIELEHSGGSRFIQRVLAPTKMPLSGTSMVEAVARELKEAGATKPSWGEFRPGITYRKVAPAGEQKFSRTYRLAGFSKDEERAIYERMTGGEAKTEAARATRRKKSSGLDWQDTPAGRAKYLERRAEAQRRANETGFDHGLEKNDLFKDYMISMLPMKKNRYGHELRVEVVHPEDLARTQPGHGPLA